MPSERVRRQIDRLPDEADEAYVRQDWQNYSDERAAAIQHLDFAIAELREMKMPPAPERALRHRGC